MKKFLVVLMVVLSVGSAFAFGDIVNSGPRADSTNLNTNLNTNANTNLNANANTNLNTNLNTQGQMQGQGQLQGQGQGQGQNQTAVGKVKTTVSNNTSISNPREAIFVPAVSIPTAPILSGEVTRYNLLPKFANQALTPYNGEPVISILYYSYGNIFSRITVEELPQFLLDAGVEFSDKINIRYDVICKKASHGLAVGLGGSAANTALDGNNSGGGVIGASGAFAVASPYCAVWLYSVK